MQKTKRAIAYISILIVYFAIIGAIYYREYRDSGNVSQEEENVTIVEDLPEPVADVELDETSQREFKKIDNTIAYADRSQSGMYVNIENVRLVDTDMENIFEMYRLPDLKRMASEDAEALMSELQVLDRIEALKIDKSCFNTPEYNWKEIYSDSILQVKEGLDLRKKVKFEGTSASELNYFMTQNTNCIIDIQARELVLDETIQVPSNTVIQGNGVSILGEDSLDYAILLDNVKNVGIYNIELLKGFKHGIYVIQSHNVLLWNNEITNAEGKAVCVVGDCQHVNLVNNAIYNNGNGAVFLDGNISRCIIQGNSVYENLGTRNYNAGILLGSVELENLYSPYTEFTDIYLYDIVEAPHDNVILRNLVQSNYSSGIYIDSGYMNYIIENTIEDNEKEGMCLDHGTIGTYVKGNSIQRNGDRNRQTDEDLTADFILAAGRLPDGSSKAKLPGISLDNTAYNIILENTISNNSGSGVKAVRSAYRNLIFSNIIADNNWGENDFFHGFGVELGNTTVPDEPVIGLDFTADYENIVARNVITGTHYSAVFLAEGSYCNDLIDNMMLDCEYFSVENHSIYFNGSIGNTSNVETLDYQLQ